MSEEFIKNVVEAALMCSPTPMDVPRLAALVETGGDGDAEIKSRIRAALATLAVDYRERGVVLAEVGSGYRFQVRADLSPWISRLWEERPPRYSRALLETLAIVAYRQPITRAEVEAIRGVAVSTALLRTLLEREWVRAVGHRDVPGRPAVYATTKEFLDYFGLKSLTGLPPLPEPAETVSGDEGATAGAADPLTGRLQAVVAGVALPILPSLAGAADDVDLADPSPAAAPTAGPDLAGAPGMGAPKIGPESIGAEMGEAIAEVVRVALPEEEPGDPFAAVLAAAQAKDQAKDMDPDGLDADPAPPGTPAAAGASSAPPARAGAGT
jgi:segregation and condensation protein B